MQKLSTSFTLGKASVKGGANVEHNNREFLAGNIDVGRMVDNITYVRQDVREVYDELFGEVLEQYNAKQTRKDRQIHDYFTHISEGGREEAYYEAIIQFGDSTTAGIGTPTGEFAKKMLDEYMRGFETRNPNLRVFNAVLHADEASYHIHINFIPFYTQGRKLGLNKGVSMKAALIEQGFEPKNKSRNQLVMWEDSELKAMEDILNRHGLERDIKGATHSHKSVPDYKASQDWKKLPKRKKRTAEELVEENLQALEQKNSVLESEKEKLLLERNSPWKSFYYSDPDKQNFVQSRLAELNIPIRESDNGFEAQQCHVETIRKIEKQYKPVQSTRRDILRDDIDRCAMRSRNFAELLTRLKHDGYEVKLGKYMALKSENSSQFIRLKSLGVDYTEQALRNRIDNKILYESDIENKGKASDKDSLSFLIYKTAWAYTVTFSHGILPVCKRQKDKPFTWNNCVELDHLSALNKRINEGVTLASLRNKFATLERSVSEKSEQVDILNTQLATFRKLYDYAVRVYENGDKNESVLRYLSDHKITAENYRRVQNPINGNIAEIAELEQSLSAERAELKSVSDTLTFMEKVVSGTYVDLLVRAEKERRQSAQIGNGLKLADGGSADSNKVDRIAGRVIEAVEKKSVEVAPTPPPPRTPKRK